MIPVSISHNISNDMHLSDDEQHPEGMGNIEFVTGEEEHSSGDSGLFDIPGTATKTDIGGTKTAPDKSANQINSHQTHSSNYNAKDDNRLTTGTTTTGGSNVMVSNDDNIAGSFGDV